MRTVTLPGDLGEAGDLAALNRELRAGTAGLDWSNVITATDRALATLLDGLDLVHSVDVLGLETVPDALSKQLLPWLEPTPVLAPPSPHALRQQLTELVVNELLGPSRGDEEIIAERRVYDRYLVGMLAPPKSSATLDSDADGAAGGAEAAMAADETEEDEPGGALESDELPLGDDGSGDGAPADVPPAMPSRGPGLLVPTSFGLSFCVEPHVAALQVTARWGRYERTPGAGPDGKPAWQRVPVEGTAVIELRPGYLKEWRPSPDQDRVLVTGRLIDREGYRFVTLFLRNQQQEQRRNRDEHWLFQAELSVCGIDGASVFCRRPQAGSDSDEKMLAMLYRRRVEFATGHNTAVHVETEPGRPDRALRVRTQAVPSYDVPRTEVPSAAEEPLLADLVLDMQRLGEETDTDTLCRRLDCIPHAYEAWIARREAQLESEPDLAPFRPPADPDGTGAAALARCREAATRIRAGIELLRRDTLAAKAFRFMNCAMALQRVHTIFAEGRRRADPQALDAVDRPPNRSWYPFQLAFILLNLPGIADLGHAERSTAPEAALDLLWFPTGGGKTEAYLGLTAFTLAIRRLQGVVAGHTGDEGVAVLMRYTLRLLTLQQFQRAATLICATEVLRRRAVERGDRRWGATPFRIGLWVGRGMAPNTWDEADEWLKSQSGRAGGGGSPAQLTDCPWCGATINPYSNIRANKARRRVVLYCGDPLGECPFSERRSRDEGLPVVVTDEEIYRLLPAMLIATVDKFAQLPWNGSTQALFGRVTHRCERHGFRVDSTSEWESGSHPRSGNDLPAARTVECLPPRPPDLIIQDELHLISGPLGTLVGLYETAIDRLAGWSVGGRDVRPKVIASTATIRRAERQVHALFLRRVQIFPPPGLDVADSFFARQREPSAERPGRRYLGICAQGRRLKVAMIRVYVAHLAAAQKLYNAYGAAADPWMTLVGYFNAMRELGGMRRVVEDNVTARLRQIEQRGLANRKRPSIEELTSRRSSSDIPRVLRQLETPFDPNLLPNGTQRARPIGVLLATNMLSVGVDVPRLGLMVVATQPKTTAEYIQATSRVGRAQPGLICTVFQWARPRDLSHYERFEHYHATFYQQVEALSVTPFAARARDRALSALLVGLVRLQGPEFNPNLAAGRITRDHPALQDAIAVIARRAAAVTGDEALGESVRADLQRRRDIWLSEAALQAGGSRLGYREKRDGQTKGLLQPPDSAEWGYFTCPTSLREVEPAVALILNDNALRGDAEPAWQPQGMGSST